jgi:outer membrane cobalamin receptor
MTSRTLLLASAALVFPASAALAQQQTAAPAATQTTATPPAATQPVDETGEEEDIVITGQRPRGSVVGDIPPENTLDARDVRATGATNINELLEALAPQIGSVRGRGGEQPVLLLNGQRISGFRELRDIPTEAIVRVEILPEEVALKYGYRADQKVVNIVLRSASARPPHSSAAAEPRRAVMPTAPAT